MTLYTATEISFASVFGVVLICMIEYPWNTLAYSFALLKIELNVWQLTETTRMFIEFSFVCLFVFLCGILIKSKSCRSPYRGRGAVDWSQNKTNLLKPKQNQFIEAKTKPIYWSQNKTNLLWWRSEWLKKSTFPCMS